MSIVARYTDFRSIFAEGGVDPNATMALDGMQPWPVDLVRANAIPEIEYALGSTDMSPLSIILSINAGVVDGGAAFDWYVSQRTDDPARQWLVTIPVDGTRSGSIIIEITDVGLAQLGLARLSGELPPMTADQIATAIKFVDVYCLRRSDGAIQRRALSTL